MESTLIHLVLFKIYKIFFRVYTREIENCARMIYIACTLTNSISYLMYTHMSDCARSSNMTSRHSEMIEAT